MTKIAA
jgi:regulator of sigma E protease